MISRRNFLATIVGAPIATVFYTLQVEPHWLKITSPSLPIPQLPAGLQGATLAQLSDLHVGPQVADAYIRHSFERVTRLQPDFVVYTGDWISYVDNSQIEQLARVLDNAPHGQLG